MSTAELKTDIHTLIDKTNDNNVLKIIYKILSGRKEDTATTVRLSSPEKKAIDAAIKSVKKGIKIPHIKVMEEMKKKYPSLHK